MAAVHPARELIAAGSEPHRCNSTGPASVEVDVGLNFEQAVATEQRNLLRYATALCGDPEQGRDVHVRITPDGPYPLTIHGRAALYRVDHSYTAVRIVYNKTTDVGFQAPPSAHLTRAQALRIARTLDVRSVKHKTDD